MGESERKEMKEGKRERERRRKVGEREKEKNERKGRKEEGKRKEILPTSCLVTVHVLCAEIAH